MRTHRVKTGETAWGLSSSEFEVPLWVLAYYNPDVNLERLRIGQELHYPLVQSTVEAELAQSDTEGETAAVEPDEEAREPEIDDDMFEYLTHEFDSDTSK